MKINDNNRYVKSGCGALFVLLMLNACSFYNNNDKIARNKDFFNRLSASKLVAEKYVRGTHINKADSSKNTADSFTIGKIRMRKNGSFVMKSNISWFKIHYYQGKYLFVNDTIWLNFANQYQPNGIHDKGIVMEKSNNMGKIKFENGDVYFVVKNKF